MAKQKAIKNTNKKNIIDKKLNILKKYPNSIPYTFKSQLIQERYLNHILESSAIYTTILDNWGINIDTKQKTKIDEVFSEMLEKAKDIIEKTDENIPQAKKFFEDFSKMRKFEKEEIVKDNGMQNGFILLIPFLGKQSLVLYKTIVYMDNYDAELKIEIGEPYVELITSFLSSILKFKSLGFQTIIDNIPSKYINDRNLKLKVEKKKSKKKKSTNKAPEISSSETEEKQA